MTYVAVGFLVAAVLVAWMPWVWQQTLIKKQVVVNLKSGNAFRGIAYRRRGNLLILKQASVTDGKGWTTVDGETVLKLSEIDFIQVP